MTLIDASGRPVSAGGKQPGAAGSVNQASDPGALIKDGTDATFKTDVIDESMQQPVLIDFWAPWCGPCRTLGPALEKAVTAARGKVKLVKINIDQNPAYAQQLRVQSIPAVFVIDQGKPVDGFMGAVPESQIKALIDRVSGDAVDGVDDALAAAHESLSLGDIGGAAQSFAAVLQIEPNNGPAIAGLARVYLASGQPDQARATIADLPPEVAALPEVKLVQARLDLAAEAEGVADAAELANKVEVAPNDHQARFDYAIALTAQGDLENAVDQLLRIVQAERGWNDDAARKQVLKVFDAAGPDAELSKQGRRQLSSILFS